ncbi:MAG: putative S-layer protein [archaeon]
MKIKTLSLLCVSVFTLILLSSLTTAVVTFEPTEYSATVDQGNAVTVTFTVTESNYLNLTNISFNTPLTLDSGSSTLISEESIVGVITELSKGETSGDMDIVFNVASNQAPGIYTGNLILTGEYSSEVSYDFPITITVTEPATPEPDWTNDFCVWDDGIEGNPGDLRVKIDTTLTQGYGDDTEWFPFDEVEVEVTVDNKGDDDVDNIEVEWGLYDHDLEEWVIDVDNEKDFDVKDGDDEVITFTFTIDDKMDVDLEDLDDGKHYSLYVRTTGEVDNDNNDDTCEWDSEDIEIIIERDFVVVSNLEFQETVSCGTELRLVGDVWNIGDRDQDEVSVKVFNKELSFSEIVEIGDINSFESENLDMIIKIPSNAKEKSYIFSLEVYDEDNDIYENDYDDESSTSILVRVEGSCSDSPTDDGGDTTGVSAIVSAVLESGGKAGQNLVIKATITNTGDQMTTFLLNAAGYAGWADSADLERDSVILGPGDSEDILITFQVMSDAKGDQLFNLEVVSEKELVAVQPVSVSIETSSFDISSSLGENWYLWLIGLLNVILVVIIIVVAIRVARK